MKEKEAVVLFASRRQVNQNENQSCETEEEMKIRNIRTPPQSLNHSALSGNLFHYYYYFCLKTPRKVHLGLSNYLGLSIFDSLTLEWSLTLTTLLHSIISVTSLTLLLSTFTTQHTIEMIFQVSYLLLDTTDRTTRGR